MITFSLADRRTSKVLEDRSLKEVVLQDIRSVVCTVSNSRSINKQFVIDQTSTMVHGECGKKMRHDRELKPLSGLTMSSVP